MVIVPFWSCNNMVLGIVGLHHGRQGQQQYAADIDISPSCEPFIEAPSRMTERHYRPSYAVLRLTKRSRKTHRGAWIPSAEKSMAFGERGYDEPYASSRIGNCHLKDKSAWRYRQEVQEQAEEQKLDSRTKRPNGGRKTAGKIP